MSVIVYRANLSSAVFPMLSEFMGNTVIVKQYDQSDISSINNNTDSDNYIKVALPYYMENVMPTESGYQSVGYIQRIPAATANGGDINFRNIFEIFYAAQYNAYIGICSDGKLYMLLTGSTVWLYIVNLNTYGTWTTTTLVTVANINGQSYICIQGVAILVITFSDLGGSLVVSPQSVPALTLANVIGITSCFGYLIAYTTTAVYWSSLVNPLDFAPSLITGAGGGEVQQARSAITLIVYHKLGAIIYTANNAIAMVYSGNSRYPFNFREIVEAGGLDPAYGGNQYTIPTNYITFDPDTGDHYIYGTSGIQLVNTQNAKLMFSAVASFVSGKYLETWDKINFVFTKYNLTSDMVRKITVVASRYIVVSYGQNIYTYALVYDIGLKRWGKLFIDHADVFDFSEEILNATADSSRDEVGFLQADGTIVSVDFTLFSSVADGTLILGKYQFVRSRFLQLQEIEIENLNTATGNIPLQLTVAPSQDGKNWDSPVSTLTPTVTDGQYVKYTPHITAKNHSLILQGQFNLNTVILSFNIHGRR